ncbi:hypothetical protein IS481_12025 [Caldimonas thermodepolymerans]|uniref:hypothetical protein n=1 Tax=Caldimonas thermodepolymerans TaxID=215580 RepID=UPI0011B07B86|nr:hypothetical protein [Caldimonas thermodepolymerans]QPC30497.1 hypothetical protein IS481_12025 [Caldimonas thermodepolymerans]
MSTRLKVLLIALAAALAALLVTQWRSSLIELGRMEERAAAAERLAQERKYREEAVAKAEAESRARFDLKLAELQRDHDQILQRLQAELHDSELRNVRLTRELARLHDAAATGVGTAPATGPPGGEAPAPEDVAGPTGADLLMVATENYAICHRTAAQLVELQDWYEALRLRLQASPGK